MLFKQYHILNLTSFVKNTLLECLCQSPDWGAARLGPFQRKTYGS